MWAYRPSLREEFTLEELGFSHQADSENANHAQGVDLQVIFHNIGPL